MTKIKSLPFAFLNHRTNGSLKENQLQHYTLKGKSKNRYTTNNHINNFLQGQGSIISSKRLIIFSQTIIQNYTM